MEHLKIYKEKNYQAVSRRAANLISAQIILKPDSILGLATGSSPIEAYNQLVKWYENGDLDFSHVTSVNLDEYIGLTPDNPNSYHYFMKQNLFSHVNIPLLHTHIPNGNTDNLLVSCKSYDDFILSVGGIDLQLLGIGSNGHIGFNEPGAGFILDTHVVNLTEDTIQANARLFDDLSEVPKQAITMGIRNILQAEKIVLIATGTQKANALYKSLLGPVTPEVPASILQLHKNVSIVADPEALEEIPDSLCIHYDAS